MDVTVLHRVRRIDPAANVDDVVDVLIANGLVARIGPPGDAASWLETSHAHQLGPTAPGEPEQILCPGLVDLHTHVFGSAAVPNIDDIGVHAGVPIVVDAGGAGAATIDDFVSYRLPQASTRVLAFMSVEAAGITDRSSAHNTGRTAAQMQTASLDAFLGAIDRHDDRIVGLKLWATVKAGLGWVDHATNLSELIQRPLLVHIGEVSNGEVGNGTDRTPITGDALDRLQGGDIVTHCFTALPGALIDGANRISPEVYAARERGVHFDAASGLINLDFGRAVAAMEQGWLPDVISTDVNRWSVTHPSASTLPRAMTSFLAMGLSLRATIERASVVPAEILGATVGRPLVGQPATLSLLARTETATICSDGTNSITGTELLEPVGCFVDGTWFEAHPPEAPVHTSYELTESGHEFLCALYAQLLNHREHDSRWRGAELHQLTHRSRVDSGTSISDALDALYTNLGDDQPALAAGWLLEGLGPDSALERLRAAVTR